MIRAGIIGGAGYTGGELLRILLFHPEVEIAFVQSRSQQGKRISEVHEDLIGSSTLTFTDSVDPGVDVLFLCGGHGQSKSFLEEYSVPEHVAVIDMSRDFRLDPSFVYGLPELNKAAICGSRRIANCGCFATAIQLALLPMANAHLLDEEIHVHAITGSTGAGQTLQPTTHFSWRYSNLSIYNPFDHPHLPEIRRSLVQLQPDFQSELNFIPVRGNFTRGILTSVYTKTSLTLEELDSLYHLYYQDEPFTLLTSANPHLKQVVNTNKCLLHIEKHGDKVLIVSLLDNLVKGASGQAVQNMNLLFGLEETAGLLLKSAGF